MPRYEAVVFEWQRAVDIDSLRELVARCARAGLYVGVTHDGSVDEIASALRSETDLAGRVLVAAGAPPTVYELRANGLHALASATLPAALWSRGIAAAQLCRTDDDPAGVLHEQLAQRASVPVVPETEGWCVVVDGIDPTTERAHSALLTLADGCIGTAGAPLFAAPHTEPGVVAAGVYDGTGPLTDLLSGPQWDRLTHAFAPNDRDRRVLDLRTGVLGESVRGTHQLSSVRFSSLARPGVAVLRADVTPPDDGPALVPPAHGGTGGEREGMTWFATHGFGGSITAAAAQRCHGARIERIAAYVTASGSPAPDDALARAQQAQRAGFDQLLDEQRRAWADRWERADVAIDGDPGLQRAVRLGLFHLMGSVADRGEAAVGARGLSGHAYRGHVFWDADLFVLPFLAATHPPAARAMLEYRVRRLPVARERARREGRAGARFAWESAGTGEDVTPEAGRDQTGHVVPIRTGANEIHIVGDIAWATCFYIDWTGDRAFAEGPGREILVETARYWASRMRVDGTGRGHLYGVIGPDEYHEPVDDNAYTNVLARWNLRRAADVAGDTVGADERARWRALADAMLDGYDRATGVYEQFAGFYDLEPLLIAEVAPRRPITADLLLGRDRVRGAQVVKQADVLMLHHLLPDDVEPGSLEPNLDYYEPRTAHGSSLSPAIHASVFARANRMADAVGALRLAANIDLDDLTNTGAGGVHLASMGGVWQALAFGFFGLRAQGSVLALDPRLPPDWDALELRVQFRGVALVLTCRRDTVNVHADAPVTLSIRNVRVRCAAGDNIVPLR